MPLKIINIGIKIEHINIIPNIHISNLIKIKNYIPNNNETISYINN